MQTILETDKVYNYPYYKFKSDLIKLCQRDSITQFKPDIVVIDVNYVPFRLVKKEISSEFNCDVCTYVINKTNDSRWTTFKLYVNNVRVDYPRDKKVLVVADTNDMFDVIKQYMPFVNVKYATVLYNKTTSYFVPDEIIKYADDFKINFIYEVCYVA